MTCLLNKNTNSIFIIVILLGILISACKKKEDDPPVIVTSEVVVSPNFIDVYDNFEFKVHLTSYPAGTVNWQVTNSEDWLSIEPESGTINSDIVEISMKTDITGLNPGVKHAYVNFSRPDALPSTIHVQLHISESAQGFTLSPHHLEMDYGQDTSSFRLFNTSDIAINWTTENNPDFISLSETSGSIDANNSMKLDVELDRTNLETGEYEFPIVITSSIGISDSVLVSIKHYGDEIALLPMIITHASYLRLSNKIALVVAEPMRFLLLDPETLETESVEIPNNPICLSVEPNENMAILGYPNSIIPININDLSLGNVIAVEEELYSVVMKDQEWAYVFPTYADKAGKGYHLQSVKVSSGESFVSDFQIDPQQYSTLHPSGNYIYAKTKGSSPGSYSKYDVHNGEALELYEVSDWSLASTGKLWLTSEGDRLFTEGRLILRTSEIPEEDLVYGGFIGSENGWLLGYDDSPQYNKIFALLTEGYSDKLTSVNVLQIYSLDYVTYLETIRLPYFFVEDYPYGGEVYKPDGKWVFVNETDNKVYVLQKAENNYPGFYDWGLVSLSID